LGIIKLLADFSKAAYNITHKFHKEDPTINDPSPHSAEAFNDILKQGWAPLKFTTLSPSINSSGYINFGMTDDGMFINGNAAVFAARQGDSIVLAFRGTNDTAKEGANPKDPNNTVHPDEDQWGRMPDYYNALKPFLTQFDDYVKSNNIKNVYVTGHSMGGAMALEYMSLHSGPQYQAVTFAATPFGQPYLFISAERKYYPPDDRITQIEIANDPGPRLFDWKNLIGNTRERPGHLIEIQGNETMDNPDYHSSKLVINFYARDSNHSMDYYRQISQSIDDSTWDLLLKSPGKHAVFIGAQEINKQFIVDGKISGTNQIIDAGNDVLESKFGANVIYAGRGNDQIIGDQHAEYILAGDGNDTISGNGGNDIVFAGLGNDTMDFSSTVRAGSDTFYGGLGDDTFYFDSPNDQFIEYYNEGNDTAWVNFDYSLLYTPNIENLRGYGTSGVKLFGNSLDNLLSGTNGNDVLEGGAGKDTVELNGKISDYKITRTGNTISLLNKKTNEGIDTLINIESLKFADVSSNLEIQALAKTINQKSVNQILELYIAFFNRIPEAEGVAYWLGEFKKGSTINQIAESFYNAGLTFSNLTGYSATMPNSDFVKVVYKNVLGRSDGGDASGVAYWSEQLSTQKATRGSLVSDMLNSAHGFKNDAKWGWVANLLDNKVTVAKTIAIDFGINYSSSEAAIRNGMMIASYITDADINVALSIIGVSSVDVML
jgi:Ca2+-binding RTX toxin-like protein